MTELPFQGRSCNLCGYLLRTHSDDPQLLPPLMRIAQEYHLANEHPEIWARIKGELQRARRAQANAPRVEVEQSKRLDHHDPRAVIRCGACDWAQSLPSEEPYISERLNDTLLAHFAVVHPDLWIQHYTSGILSAKPRNIDGRP